MIRTGIFGGGFDPPHIGHIRLAAECITALKLQRLLVIPTGDKAGSTPYDTRLCMAKLAFDVRNMGEAVAASRCKVEVLDIERGTRSKTYDTLRKLKPLYRNSDFYVIIGSDQLFNLENWYRYESLLNEAKIAAFPRRDNEYADMLEEAARVGGVRVLNFPVTEVSSTDIRAGADGGALQMLTPVIAEYVKSNNLYT